MFKYVAFFVFIWVTGSLLGAIMDEAYLGTGEATALDQMSFWQQISEEENFGTFEVIGAVGDFFVGFWKIVTFQYTFLDGTDWALYEYFVLAPLTVGFFALVILTLMGIFKGTG